MYPETADPAAVAASMAEKQAALDALGVRWEVRERGTHPNDDISFPVGIYILQKDVKKVRAWEHSLHPRASSSEALYEEVYKWQYES